MNIKKLVLSMITFLILPVSVMSQTASPSAKPTGITPTTIEEKQIESIKEKIADKVAELRKKNNKAYSGIVTDIQKNNITIKSRDATVYTVKIDPSLTQFYQVSGTQLKDLKQDDIEKNDYIISSGPITDKTINANVVYVDEQLFVKAGKLTEVNTTEKFIKVTTSDKDTLTLDIVLNTTMQLVDSKTLEIAPTTLAKLKEGDTIHFVYKLSGDETQVNRYNVQKVLIIPQEYFVK